MNAFIAVLITATLGTSPIQYVNNLKTNDFTYVCYIQNESLMLIKMNKDFSYRTKDIVDTGISTKDIENVTMNSQDDKLILEVRYKESECRDCVAAIFDSRTLELEQISTLEPDVLASMDPLH